MKEIAMFGETKKFAVVVSKSNLVAITCDSLSEAQKKAVSCSIANGYKFEVAKIHACFHVEHA